MPMIKEYNSSVEVAGPVEHRRAHGDEFGFGKGLENLGQGIQNAAGVLHQRQQQAEVSNLSAQMIQLHAEKTTEVDNQIQQGHAGISAGTAGAADTSGATGTVGNTGAPDNTDMSTKFMDGLNARLDKIREGITTPAAAAHFETQKAEMLAHFQGSIHAAQAHLAGVQAVENAQTALNVGSSSLVEHPSDFETVRKMQHDSLDALVATGGLPAKEAVVLKAHADQELATSAIKGWIRLSPDLNEVRKKLEDGTWDKYINGDKKKEMYGEIRQEEHGRIADQAQKEKLLRDAQAQAQTATQNQFLDMLNSGKLTKDAVSKSNLDPFGSGSKETFYNLMKQHADDKLKDDGHTVKDTLSRIMLPEGDPRKITNEKQVFDIAVSKGGMSLGTIDWMNKHLQEGRTEAGKVNQQLEQNMLKEAETLIAKKDAFQQQDPGGAHSYSLFFSAAAQKKLEWQSAGKDTRPLFDPRSKDYIGNDIPSYVLNPQERMHAQAALFRNQAAPAQQAQGQQGPMQGPPVPAHPALKPADIAGLDLDGLMKLNKSAMTREQLDAADARWHQLKKAGKK